MKRLRLACCYAVGSRLHEYHRILQAALDAGYRVCSVGQSLEALDAGVQQLFVLRHDVDQLSPGVIGMADVEAQLRVFSTYYFRLSTLARTDVVHVKGLGHEVGFHYETIADYALESGIRDRALLESAEHLQLCARRLEHDLLWFRATAGVPCRTLASHGAPLNRVLSLSNRVLFDSDAELAGRLGVLEVYDPGYLGHFDRYISDTQWEINDGFRYGVHPLRAIAAREERIIMLTHPNHWDFTWRTRARRTAKSLLLGQRVDRSSFAEADRLRRR